MSKLNKVLLVGVILLLIVLAVVLWKPSVFNVFKPSYYAVYLTSGDLYFGKTSCFNHEVLTDVRMIQKEQTDEKTQPQLNLVKFKDAFWGPSDELRLNEKNILWTVKLSEESQVVKLINEQK